MNTATDRPPPPIPPRPTPANLRETVQECRACDLWEDATQAVMGEGARHASLMLVGEQPGDREDLEGHPFVGPAGRVLDRGMQEAGIDTGDVYITNVVKHFRYRARGKRRIHQTPDRWQVNACLPWLQAEVAMVKPTVLMCLGATAGKALLGSQIRIGRDRGTRIDSDLAELVTLTAHPSSILRERDDAAREEAMGHFVSDLSHVAQWLSAR
jgi:uracil-DNA glycosylase